MKNRNENTSIHFILVLLIISQIQFAEWNFSQRAQNVSRNNKLIVAKMIHSFFTDIVQIFDIINIEKKKKYFHSMKEAKETK